MSFGFPAYHQCSETFSGEPNELHQMIEKTFAELHWPIEIATFSSITASVPITWASWGEKFSVSFDAGKTMTVRSECLLPTQCFDWNKNRKNVSRFLGKLRSLEKFADIKPPDKPYGWKEEV